MSMQGNGDGTTSDDARESANVFGILRQMLQHMEFQTKVSAHEVATERKPQDFRLVIPSVGSGGVLPITSANRGRIMSVQNPTANPIILTLTDDDNSGILVFSAQIAAYGYQNVWVPFFSRLYAKSGAGVIIAGELLQ